MFTIVLVAYSQKMIDRLDNLRHAGLRGLEDGNAVWVNFTCGSAIKFEVSVDQRVAKVDRVAYGSNGCGFMLAAAETLAEVVSGKCLNDLNGLSSEGLFVSIRSELGPVPNDREPCIIACIEALRGAFADHRRRQVEEFRGEKALICTCFAVTEETIVEAISKNGLKTIIDVTNACGAGGGCGSCRMLIDEMLAAPVTREQEM